MAQLLNLLISPLGLPMVDPLWEWAILLVIGIVSYNVAFSFVGERYRDGFIHGNTIGSIMHWIVRIFVFIVIWASTYLVIWVGLFLFNHWMIVTAVSVCIIISVIFVKLSLRKTL